MSQIPIFERHCRISKDTRGLHSGEWFIAQARMQARSATLHMAGVIAIVIVVALTGYLGMGG